MSDMPLILWGSVWNPKEDCLTQEALQARVRVILVILVFLRLRHDNMWMIRLLFTAGFVAYVVRGRDCLRRYKVQCNQVLPGHPAPAFTNLKWYFYTCVSVFGTIWPYIMVTADCCQTNSKERCCCQGLFISFWAGVCRLEASKVRLRSKCISNQYIPLSCCRDIHIIILNN